MYILVKTKNYIFFSSWLNFAVLIRVKTLLSKLKNLLLIMMCNIYGTLGNIKAHKKNKPFFKSSCLFTFQYFLNKLINPPPFISIKKCKALGSTYRQQYKACLIKSIYLVGLWTSAIFQVFKRFFTSDLEIFLIINIFVSADWIESPVSVMNSPIQRLSYIQAIYRLQTINMEK